MGDNSVKFKQIDYEFNKGKESTQGYTIKDREKLWNLFEKAGIKISGFEENNPADEYSLFRLLHGMQTNKKFNLDNDQNKLSLSELEAMAKDLKENGAYDKFGFTLSAAGAEHVQAGRQNRTGCCAEPIDTAKPADTDTQPQPHPYSITDIKNSNVKNVEDFYAEVLGPEDVREQNIANGHVNTVVWTDTNKTKYIVFPLNENGDEPFQHSGKESDKRKPKGAAILKTVTVVENGFPKTKYLKLNNPDCITKGETTDANWTDEINPNLLGHAKYIDEHYE